MELSDIYTTKASFEALSQLRILEIHFLGKGACNNVYYIKTDSGAEFTVKQQRSDMLDSETNTLLKEAEILKFLGDLDDNLFPKVLFISGAPLMYAYRYFQGSTLEKALHQMIKVEIESLMFLVGKHIASLHSVILQAIDINNLGLKSDEKTILDRIKQINSLIEQNNIPHSLTSEIVERLTFLQNKYELSNITTMPIHGDIHKGNIIINNNNIGFIDYGDIRISEVYNEFSHLAKQFPEYIQIILDGYNSISNIKIETNIVQIYGLVTDIEKTIIYHLKRVQINAHRIASLIADSTHINI